MASGVVAQDEVKPILDPEEAGEAVLESVEVRGMIAAFDLPSSFPSDFFLYSTELLLLLALVRMSGVKSVLKSLLTDAGGTGWLLLRFELTEPGLVTLGLLVLPRPVFVGAGRILPSLTAPNFGNSKLKLLLKLL